MICLWLYRKPEKGQGNLIFTHHDLGIHLTSQFFAEFEIAFKKSLLLHVKYLEKHTIDDALNVQGIVLHFFFQRHCSSLSKDVGLLLYHLHSLTSAIAFILFHAILEWELASKIILRSIFDLCLTELLHVQSFASMHFTLTHKSNAENKAIFIYC